MTDRRKEDSDSRTHFRSPRLFEEKGQWFFHTREGTIEGPYRDRQRAVEMLDAYVRTINSPFAPRRDLSVDD
jgi:hypothetical protein